MTERPPLTMLGDDDGLVCENGVCVLPAPAGTEPAEERADEDPSAG